MTVTEQHIATFQKGITKIEELIARLKIREDYNRYMVISPDSILKNGLISVYQSVSLLIDGFDINSHDIIPFLESYHEAYDRLFSVIDNNATDSNPVLIARQIECRIYNDCKRAFLSYSLERTISINNDLKQLEDQFSAILPYVIEFINRTKYDARQLDRIERKVEETNSLINRLWDWFREIFFKYFTKVFGIRKEATPELALEMLVRKNSYLRCFEKTKMKEPHKSQVIAVVEYVRNGHPIDHNARQNEIQSKTAYTINQAAEDVLRIAAEPCHKLSGAWTKAKDLADGCRQFMGKEDDPFVYKS